MRLRTIGLALKSFVWVLLAFGIYAVLVVPLVEPRSRDESHKVTSRESVAARSTDRYVRELKSLFRPGDWELQEPKLLRSDQATVLLKDYRVLKDGSLELTPCTLIFYGDREKEADRGPVIMRAEGAQLVFDRPLDPSRMEIGKPVRGGLFGDIHIHSSGIPGKSESLDLFTRNLIITEQQTVRTREQVTFKIGAHQGSGQDLILRRVEGGPAAAAKDDQWLGGLGMLELHRLDRLTVRMAGDKLFSAFGAVDATNAPPTDVELSTVEVLSDGPLRFDFQNLIAKLEDHVRITRSQAGMRPDTITADQISLHMERAARKPDAEDSDGSAMGKRALTVTRLIATGNPLIVDAPSESAYVQAKRLEYDFGSGQIKLKGFNPFATGPRDESTSNVILRNPQHSVSAPSVDILMDPGASIASLFAAGPGTYQGRPTLDGDIVYATWQRQLSLRPAEGDQLLRISGSSSISSGQFASIRAEQIDFWLRETTEQRRAANGQQMVVKKKYIPSHIVAIGSGNSRVSIDSEQIRGTLRSLTIVLSSTPTLDPRPETAAGSRSPETEGSLLSGLSRPGPNQQASIYRIEGGQLKAWVDTSQAQRPRLQRLLVEGPTQLWEENSAAASDEDLLRISGSSIEFQESVTGAPVANLSGTPAVFQASGLHLRGDLIQVRGEQNRIQVPGKGWMKLQVPTSAFAGNRARTEVAAPATKTPLEVSWSGSLNFDGQTATVLDDVVANGPDLNLQTGTVRIRLDRPIDLSKLRGNQINAEVATVFADGGVLVAVRSRDEQNQTKSVQQFSTTDLQLDYISGDLLANGPGWLAHTAYGANISLTNPGAQPASAASDRLSQMSLAFGSRLTGNLHRREAHFQGGIRTWFGNVASWQERVDPLRERELGPQDARLVCNELFVLESPGARNFQNRSPIEIIARGDLQVVTEKYVAQGHEIKFAEEKDMVMLVGSGARPAEFWKRNPSGGAPAYSGQMGQIKFWPGTGDYEISELQGIDVTEIPTLSR